MGERDIEKKPSWLKRMENGSIAEARTKAFLLDRFWILERSVDVHGADFIVQRRLTSANILDDDAPRFGKIQAKFMQDEKTIQHIHEEYVVDKKGEPRREFFLIIHSGDEDNRRQFLLSAEDIKDGFSVREYDEVKKFVICGTDILSSRKYEIIVPSRALSRIEQSIRLAEFAKNRRFISWTLPSFSEFSPEDIIDDFLVPLDNWWGEIPESFCEIKKGVQTLLYEMLDVTELLGKVLKTADPLVALGILERLQVEMSRGRGASFRLPAEIYSQDLHYAVYRHREKIDLLRDNGLLDKFLLIQKKFERFVCSDLAPQMKLDRSLAYIVNISYEHPSLEQYLFGSTIKPKNELHISTGSAASDYHGVVESVPGNVTVFFVPGALYYEDNGNDWRQQIHDKLWMLRRPLMEEIFEHIVRPMSSEPN